MICAKCGKEINDSAKFCTFCGTKNSLATTDIKTTALVGADVESNLTEIMSGIDTLAVGDESEVVTVPFSANDGNLFTTPVTNQESTNSENKEQPPKVPIMPVVAPKINSTPVNNNDDNKKSKQFLALAIVIIAFVVIISIAAISFVIFSGDDTENITERTEEYTEESSENRYELSEEPTMRPNSTTQTTERPDDNGYHTVPSLRQEPTRGQDITPAYSEKTTQPDTTKPTARPPETVGPPTTAPAITRPPTTAPTTTPATRPPATSSNIEVVTGDMDGSGWSDF